MLIVFFFQSTTVLSDLNCAFTWVWR